MMEPAVTLFFESVPQIPALVETGKHDDCLKSLATTAEMMEESVYVIDPARCCFRYVSPGGVFLCGRSCKEVQQLGYDFYPQVVHPDDLSLVIRAHQVVLRFLYQPDAPLGDLSYMVFNFRIKGNKKGLMVCHKMKPMIIDNQIHYIYCTVTDSVCKTPGNLLACYKTGTENSRYSFESNEWVREPAIQHTPREKTHTAIQSKIKFHCKKMEIPTGNGEVARYYSDLMYVIFKDVYCWLHFADKKYYRAEVPLSYIQEHIPAPSFFRCNRNGLINFSFYSEYKEDTRTVIMENGTEFKLSARNITNFKKQKASLNRISPLCAHCLKCETKHCPDRDQFFLPE